MLSPLRAPGLPWRIYTIGNNYPRRLTDVVTLLEHEFGCFVRSGNIRNLPSHAETLCCRGALFLRSLHL